MAYLQINSTNPNLSYVLMKSPLSGMSLRRYRRGTYFGWYSNEAQTYNMYFKDGDDEVSFNTQEEEFEYNDTKRYNSPLAIQGAVNQFLHHLTNVKSDYTYDIQDKYDHELVINQLHMFDVKYLTLMERYYPQFKVEYTELSPKNYRVSIKSTTCVRDLINFSYILSIFYHCLTDFKGTWVAEEEIFRYTTILNNLDSPYFIRYVIKSRVIKSPNKFNSVKAELEKCSTQVIELEYGDTHSQRCDFIIDHISTSDEIIDLGCNNMTSYGLKLAKELNKTDITYHAIDIDEEALKQAERKVNLKNLENVIFYNDLNDLIAIEYKQKFNIIMSEVFEHISLKEDTKIIKNIVKNLDFNKFIITTPNKDFNEYYNFTEDQTRLDDHVFEMTQNEFKNYFDELLGKLPVTYEFYHIGDKVNGITPTQAIIISKK